MYPIYLDYRLYNLSINIDEIDTQILYYYKPSSFFLINFETSYEIDTIMTRNYNLLVKLVTCHATEFINS